MRTYRYPIALLSVLIISSVLSVMRGSDTAPVKKAVVENSKLSKTRIVDKVNFEAGEIPIVSGWSPTGAKTYTVQINLPAGLSEIATPQIAISYSSHQGDSYVGRGWSISGISSIIRGGKSVYFDGRTDAINMDNGDSFSLDGIRMIKPYSPDSTTVYRTEQGNIKIIAHNHSTGRFDYFDVFLPNGAKAKYGIEGDCNALVFPIVEMSDPWGNKIKYEYLKHGGLYLISKIYYSAVTINFSYVSNPSPNMETFSGGEELTNGKLLETIECRYSGADIGSYSLTYKQQLGCSLLSKINYTSNNKKFNSLTFTYGDDNSTQSYTALETTLPEYLNGGNNEVSYVQGKFGYGTDGDGLVCLPNFNPYLGLGRDANGVEQFKNKCSENQKIPVYTSLDGNMAECRGVLTAEKGFVDILCADITATKEEYIIKINNYFEFSIDKLYFTVYDMSRIGGIQRKNHFYFEFKPEENATKNKFRPKDFLQADFDGDGKMEIMAIASNQPYYKSTEGTKCYVFDLNTGNIKYSGFPFEYLVDRVGTETLSADAAHNNSDRLFPVDIDGDGRHELCHINKDATDFYRFETGNGSWGIRKIFSLASLRKWDIAGMEVIPCDMNGDGLTDLVISPENDNNGYVWTVYFSKGNGTFKNSSFKGPRNNSKEDDNGFFFQDMNNDGLPDIVSYTPSAFYIYDNSPDMFASGGPNSYSRKLSYPSGDVPKLVPVNLMSRNSFTRLISVRKNKVIRYIPKDVRIQYVCTGMANSLGLIEHNYYAFANDIDASVCVKGTDAVYPYINLFEGLILISESRTYLNGESLQSTSYVYENPVLHRQGLGFIGFKKVYTTDNRGRTSIKTFDPFRRGIMTEEVSNVSESRFSYDLITDSDKILTINMKSATVKDLLKGTVSTTSNTFDGYGNILTSKTTYNDGNSVTKTYTYDNSVGAVPSDGYHIGYHVDEKETISYNGDTHVSRVAVPSHTRGSPLKRVTYSNGVVVKTEEFQYDSRGLTVKASEKAYSSSNAHTSTFAYDSLGRVVSKTDPLGRTNRYAYNKSGQLERETDFHNQYVQYSYDEFGREKMRYVPETGPTYTAYSWSKTGEPGLYCKSVSPTNRNVSYLYYDALNREVGSATTRFDGTLSYTATNYDRYGRVKSESLPYLKGKSPDKWTEYTYDGYDRVTRIDYPSGAYVSHSYNGLSETVEENQIATTTVYDAMGRTLSVTDPSGKVTYTLRADGQPDKITASGGAETLFEYDTAGRITLRHDPSEGNTSFTYDSGGNTSSVTDARGKTVSYEYDSHGRVTKTQMPEMTVTDTYDPATGYLTRSESSNGHSLSMAYDSHGRVIKSVEVYGDVSLEKTHTYLHGDLYKTVYKSHRGLTETETFSHNFGHLISVAISDGTKIFERKTVNSLGQTTRSLHGPITKDCRFDEYGSPTGRSYRKDNLVAADMSWDFDPYTGNLLSRTDNVRHINEEFDYDGLNRLTGYGSHTVDYGPNGNILAKSDAGTFSYTSAEKPYALTKARFSDPLIPTRQQTVTYASFRRPLTLKEGSASATFTYGAGLDRLTMRLRADGTITTRHYLGGCYEYDYAPYLSIGIDTYSSVLPPAEKDTTVLVDPKPAEIAASRIERLYLGGDAYTAPAVLVKTGSKADDVKLYFIVRDYLGSILALVDRDGKTEQELSYDAWGRLRDPDTHVNYAVGEEPELLLGRGYCGHEHLPQFGLINMNARLYDPVLGRFLSPDPYVQDPAMPQNFNRYSYCLNNPLCYVDKDGEFVFLPVLVGALVGGMVNLTVKGLSGELNSIGDYFAAFGIGAVAGGAAVFTGGAVMGLASGAFAGGGFLSGMLAGATIGATETLLLSAGNSIGFGDKFVSVKDFAISVATSAVICGGISGITAVRQGQNFFKGSYVNVPSAPVPEPGNLSKNISVQDLPKNATSLANPVSENTNIGKLSRMAQEEVVDHEKIRRLADELGPHLDTNLKPYQELRVTWIEGNQQLSFRIETHDKLNLIFPEYSIKDQVYHMNVQLFNKNSHGKYINPVRIFRSNDASFIKIII